MKCDIIIPIWNQLDYTKNCIENLIKNTNYPYRLILVDNGSDNETRQYLEELRKKRMQDVNFIRNDDNLGFVKAANQGLRYSTAQYVCILNNDTIPAPGWLGELIDFAQRHKDVGLLNPQCDGHGNIPIDTYARMLSEKNKDKYMEMNQCQGFCMLIKREVIDKIGFLDEAFGIGGFDDTDYSMRAGIAGYKCVSVHSSYVYHSQHASFDAMGNRKTLVSEGEREYFKKWPAHLRVGVAFSLKEGIAALDVENLLNAVLFMARQWCWVNLWVFGDVEEGQKSVSSISAEIGMPIHQNIKYAFLSKKLKNIQILLRLIERSFGAKRRKRYDLIIVDDEKTKSFLQVLGIMHRSRIHTFNSHNDMMPEIEQILANTRRQK